MEKKYYDLIISLIKEHKKYPGNEPILEDIANDVFEHSKVIVNTISNEDVIKAYFNKTISISIVTVPKKLNFSNKNRDKAIRTITIVPPVTNTVEATGNKQITNVISEIKVPEPTEINVSEVFTNQHTIINSSLEDSAEYLDLSLNNNNEFEKVSNIEEVNVEINDLNVSEAFAKEEIIEDASENVPQEDFIVVNTVDIKTNEEELILDNIITLGNEPQEASPEREVNKNFVDMMINGVPAETASPEESITIADEAEEVSDLYEAIETFEVEENNDFESIDDSLEESIRDGVLTDETFSTTEFELNTVETDDKVEQVCDLEVFENEEISEDFSLSLEQDDSLMLEEDSLNEDIDVQHVLVEENVIKESCNLPSYQSFEYTPLKLNYDTEEIYAELVDLDNKYPERKILNICDLKYNHRMSVTEIAKKLNFTIDDVISILNDIINVVKE